MQGLDEKSKPSLSPDRGEIKSCEDGAKIQLSSDTQNKLAALKQIFAVNTSNK